jgi:hypothetical protein
VPPAAAGEEIEKDARTPRAPAGAHHPPDGVCVPLHPLLNSYVQLMPDSKKCRVVFKGFSDEGACKALRPSLIGVQRSRLDISQALPQVGADGQVGVVAVALRRNNEEATAIKLP